MTDNSSVERFNGLTLAEAKAQYDNIRVCAVGHLAFRCTADFRKERLNVELSGEGLTFKKDVQVYAGKEFVTESIEPDAYQNAKIVKAWWG